MPEEATLTPEQEEKIRQEEFDQGWGEEDAKEKAEAPTDETDAPGADAEKKQEEQKTLPVDGEDGEDQGAPQRDESAAPKKKTAEKAEPEKRDLETEIESLKSDIAKNEHALRSELGRLRKAQAEPPPNPRETKAEEGPQEIDLEKVLAPVKEYEPEIADVLEKTIGPMQTELQRLLEQSAQSERNRQDATAQENLEQVEATHPKWEETVKTPEFEDWFQKQPPYVQRAAAESDDPGDMISILSSFKQAGNGSSASPAEHEEEQTATRVSTEDPKRALQKEAAETIPNKGSKPKSAPMDTFEAGWNMEDEVEEYY